MKIAIVGTSRLTEQERDKARPIIKGLIQNADEVFTGDANGIDELVRSFAHKCNCMTVEEAKDNRWEGQNGFKLRNIKIAQQADYVYSISTKIKEMRCYHCDKPNHERTGGCWTKRYAMDKLKKDGETIII